MISDHKRQKLEERKDLLLEIQQKTIALGINKKTCFDLFLLIFATDLLSVYNLPNNLLFFAQFNLILRLTHIIQKAFFAAWFARFAYVPAVQDHQVMGNLHSLGT